MDLIIIVLFLPKRSEFYEIVSMLGFTSSFELIQWSFFQVGLYGGNVFSSTNICDIFKVCSVSKTIFM